MGVLSHIFWGSYPALAKRAVEEVPKFSLLLLASLATLLVGLVLVYFRERQRTRQVWGVMRSEPVLWALAVVVAARAVTNILSIALTRAVWVAMIGLLTPFIVAMIGAWLYGEAAPRYTYRAMLLSTAGAILVIVPDWSQVSAGFTPRDVLGLIVAGTSSLLLAFYMQLVRRSHLRQVTHGLILVQQALAMSLAFAVLTAATGEDWGQWRSASPAALLAALGVIWLAQVGGNVLQIFAIGGAGASLITSLMGLRLVSALVVAGLLLGEQLVSPGQWLGAAVVVGTVTGYLWLQRRP